MQIIDRDHIKLAVYERGAGQTLACGTGSCAAAIIGMLHKSLDNSVKVSQAGGDLTIKWHGEGSKIEMHGGAKVVFTGVY